MCPVLGRQGRQVQDGLGGCFGDLAPFDYLAVLVSDLFRYHLQSLRLTKLYYWVVHVGVLLEDVPLDFPLVGVLRNVFNQFLLFSPVVLKLHEVVRWLLAVDPVKHFLPVITQNYEVLHHYVLEILFPRNPVLAAQVLLVLLTVTFKLL